jgi:hypothetical protein
MSEAPLTLPRLAQLVRALEFRSGADFWSAVRQRFGVAEIRFSIHLLDDAPVVIVDAVPEFGVPKTWIIPEQYRRELPPLPLIHHLFAHGETKE